MFSEILQYMKSKISKKHEEENRVKTTTKDIEWALDKYKGSHALPLTTDILDALEEELKRTRKQAEEFYER